MTFEQEKRAYELFVHASDLVEPELSAWLESLSDEAEVLKEVRALLAIDEEEASMPLVSIIGLPLPLPELLRLLVVKCVEHERSETK